MSSTSSEQGLSASQIEDLRLAASGMAQVKRRAFQAEMALKYCNGSARMAESRFGWNRKAVEVGLAEKRTGLICCGAQSAFGGGKRWEERHPEVATALIKLAEAQGQQDPSFRSTIAYTRLTSAEALRQLRRQGFKGEQLPAPSTMATVLNRLGYRLRKVLKAKPQKSCPKPT
ncbi:MAG: hypothetical protein WBA10_06765 [Elainellaceae cyanobacterium]